MHRQIDQDVDPILPDQIGQLIIRDSGNVPPRIHVSTNALGHRVRFRHLGICKDLELASVTVREKRQQEAANRVLP